jgi:hypothetical protein
MQAFAGKPGRNKRSRTVPYFSLNLKPDQSVFSHFFFEKEAEDIRFTDIGESTQAIVRITVPFPVRTDGIEA